MDILWAFGGLGLFLLGMLLLTGGLKALAGDSLRRMLARFTKTPLSGAVTGAATTALIQSSSATTVTAVGFVGAGLLSFSHALGIIFGANIGTTVTGWLVALVGFKLDLGSAALPLVFVGVMLRLFGRGRVSDMGWALAGFSLLFIGIDAMQQGMAGFTEAVTPGDFPEDSLLGRLQLVLAGVLITVITQSSSAGIAASLVALNAGAISFVQAASLVIGMDIGTTVTAMLATIGGSATMRQTGLSHVVFNLIAGGLAFFLLTPYIAVLSFFYGNGLGPEAQFALVGFHSLFNILTTALILPVAGPFARLVTWIVPDRRLRLDRRLDPGLYGHPATAIDAAAATLRDIAQTLFDALAQVLGPSTRRDFDPEKLQAVRAALAATETYVAGIRAASEPPETKARLMAVMHVIDHLYRLSHRCEQQERLKYLQADRRLARLTRLLAGVLTEAGQLDPGFIRRVERLRALLERQNHVYRTHVVADASGGVATPELALHKLDSARWLYRSTHHVWRALYHLQRAQDQAVLPLVEAGPDTTPAPETAAQGD